MSRLQTEPFPTIRPAPNRSASHSSANAANNTATRRRKSSNLGADPRGDTGAPSLATYVNENPPNSPISPTSPSSSLPNQTTRGHKRRKAKSLYQKWKSVSLRHTWFNPLIVLVGILAAYYVKPGPQNVLHPAIFLSYPLPRSILDPSDKPLQYGKGGRDFAFVAFYTIFFSFTREFLMQRLIRPIAIRNGIRSKAKQARFMEQFYTAIYFGVFGPFGLYVMSRSPVWYFNTDAMFEGFPHRQHEALFKAYYLLQASYWTQQAIVLLLQLEAPRKDFKELVAHHVITIALIWLSYRFHFTYMGLAVYITHDISDFFLATSKVFNYLDLSIVSPYFGFFIFVWAYCRHYLNLRILWAVLTDFATIGPFELNWETQQYKCLLSQVITFSLLAALQSVNLFWFFLILRIAWRIVFAGIKEDERSEQGSDEEEEEGSTADKKQRMQAKVAQAADAAVAASPQVLLNGSPLEDSSSATEGAATTASKATRGGSTRRRKA